MIGLLLALAAASLPKAMPQPTSNPLGWTPLSDYPTEALRRGATGKTTVLLTVDPMGRPANCSLLVTSGSAPLDERTCRSLLARARFKPEGDGVYASFAVSITWLRPGWSLPARARAQHFDLLVSVRALPYPTGQAVVAVRQLVSAAGAVEQCSVIQPGRVPLLEAAACGAAAALPGEAEPVIVDGRRVCVALYSQIAFTAEAAPPPN